MFLVYYCVAMLVAYCLGNFIVSLFDRSRR